MPMFLAGLRRRVVHNVLLLALVMIGAHPLFYSLALANAWSVAVERILAIPSPIPSQRYPSLPASPVLHRREAFWRGEYALRVGQQFEAVQTLQKGAQEDPANPLILFALGNLYARQGDLASAIRAWQQAGAWSPVLRAARESARDARWHEALAALAAIRNQGRLDGVEDEAYVLYFGLGDSSNAERLLRHAIALRPGLRESRRWRLMLADILTRENRWPEAADIYQALLRLDEKDSTARIGLGRSLYYSSHDFETAIRELQRAIHVAPSNAYAFDAIGELYRAEKRYSEAESWYKKAIELDPRNVWIVTHRVGNLLDSGAVTPVVPILEAAIRTFPDQPYLYLQLGTAYRLRGDINRAIAALEKAKQLRSSREVGTSDTSPSFDEKDGRVPTTLDVYN